MCEVYKKTCQRAARMSKSRGADWQFSQRRQHEHNNSVNTSLNSSTDWWAGQPCRSVYKKQKKLEAGETSDVTYATSTLHLVLGTNWSIEF